MTKKFILNVVLNLGIVFLLLSSVAGYNSGNMLYLGLSIALLVVLVYLKIVLLKQVSRDVQTKKAEQVRENAKQKKRATK